MIKRSMITDMKESVAAGKTELYRNWALVSLIISGIMIFAAFFISIDSRRGATIRELIILISMIPLSLGAYLHGKLDGVKTMLNFFRDERRKYADDLKEEGDYNFKLGMEEGLEDGYKKAVNEQYLKDNK